MTSLRSVLAMLLSLLLLAPQLAADDFLPGTKRLIFLGDSITHSGQFVDDFELYLFCRFPQRTFEVVNLGLSSETVSGLSEDGHAEGRFPRPDLHERLDRILTKARPDLVIACYGMNDGIYLPLDEGRFGKFRSGIERLRRKTQAAGAQIIHLTPPTFHPLSARLAGASPATLGGYNDVLDRYAEWLVAQRAEGWRVIDIHSAMNAFIIARRQSEADFVFAKDGVHANAEGHGLLAELLIDGLVPGDGAWFRQLRARAVTDPKVARLARLIRERGRLLCLAWLGEVGHLRPGVAPGLPIADAEAKAADLETQIRIVAAEISG